MIKLYMSVHIRVYYVYVSVHRNQSGSIGSFLAHHWIEKAIVSCQRH
jgi:hypothetical protein